VARAIPALPVVPADPRRDAPSLPILAGLGLTPEDVGHWRDLARLVNLDIATGNASVVFEQQWADGQFAVTSVGFTYRTRVAIPPLSGYHTLVRCSVYGNDPAGLGVVRFRGTNAASVVDIALPVAVGWTDSAGPGHLAVVTAGFPAFEEITIETDGVCRIDIIKIEYLDVNPGGLWPGADDALAAGPVPATAWGANPMDDAEVTADSPLSSDLGLNVLNNLRDLEERPRVHLGLAGYNASRAAGLEPVIADYPQRVVASVLKPRTPAVELTIAVYADGTGGAFDLWVESRWSSSLTIEFNVPQDVDTFTIAAVGPSWRFYTLEMKQTRDLDAPDHYGGFTQIAVRPSLMLLTQNVQAIAMWSR
jgi:hypothetical protein